ncbi:MAG TPA: ATP-binding protein [Verrucomicrobiae bacterium]|nr:ATP-binding protein [Verrucomicrobiae bacterium]
MNVRLQSFLYLLAIVLLAFIIFLVGRNTWRELALLHRSFSSVQAEDYYLPDYIRTAVREMNETVLRICQQRDSADQVAFKGQSSDLAGWIRSRQDTLTTPEQCEIMKLIGDQFETYVARNNDLIARQFETALASRVTVTPEMLESNAAPVFQLCADLQASEQAEQIQFVTDSKQALSWIQELLAAVLALLVGLIISGSIAVYTGVIGPLRTQLGKSRALAARNEKLASLGTLAAGVAHEIRNPLTAINVRLHSLKKGLAQNSSEQEDALVIGGEIQRLEHIVQEFLQFARPAEPKFVIVSADSIMMKIQSLFGPQLEKASISLVIESKPDIWLRVDPHQIEQVLINLVRNAAESIGHDGAITLRVSPGKARLNDKMAPVVSIEVSDTGKGISQEVQKRMFDPFFTTKEEGTGLGLVIASRIIEKHNGSLECRSEPNHGTTFTIVLPSVNTQEVNEPAT